MNRRFGYLSFLLAALFAVASPFLSTLELGTVQTVEVAVVVARASQSLAVVLGAYGLYLLASRVFVERAASKRRAHDARNVLRLLFGLGALVVVFGVITEQWVGVLFSLGVIGFAATFALQQPLFSLIGWFYIVVKRPYQVGDRVAIEGSKGDVVSVDFFVTTLWEVGGELVSTNQPSGRIITLPNSVVLSSHVYNYSWEGFPYVWNELSIQVSYETDLPFVRELLVEEADAYLGDEMAAHIEAYRERLAETPVELEVRDRPTVNLRQQESWVEFKLRYLVNPREGTRVRNELYERILSRMNEHPDRASFPASRNR